MGMNVNRSDRVMLAWMDICVHLTPAMAAAAFGSVLQSGTAPRMRPIQGSWREHESLNWQIKHSAAKDHAKVSVHRRLL